MVARTVVRLLISLTLFSAGAVSGAVPIYRAVPVAAAVPLGSPVPVAAAVPTPETRAVWQHPVEAPIIDYFRQPSNRYGPGNRGLEYETIRGQPVTAVADGQIRFAGQVGGHLFVVVAHSPQLRSTYAYLEQISVVVGDEVSQGQQLADAGLGFHLTARVQGRYVDPLPYFGQSWSVRLVAVRVVTPAANARSTGPQ